MVFLRTLVVRPVAHQIIFASLTLVLVIVRENANTPIINKYILRNVTRSVQEFLEFGCVIVET